jgi:hypothetical protein
MFKQFLTQVIQLLPAILPVLFSLFRKNLPSVPTPVPLPMPAPEPVPDSVPIPPPPPDHTPTASDYITRAVAGKWEAEFSTGEAYELYIRLQDCWWMGNVDLAHVATKCPDLCADGAEPIFPLTVDGMKAAAKVGADLVAEAQKFIGHWNEDHKDFPARSRIRKRVYGNYTMRLKAHLVLGSEQRSALAGITGTGQIFDSIKGYCEHRHANG